MVLCETGSFTILAKAYMGSPGSLCGLHCRELWAPQVPTTEKIDAPNREFETTRQHRAPSLYSRGGAATWQKQEKYSAFFALHDLTLFAVETALNYHNGFCGLIASGYNGKGSPGAIPEALGLERIVGIFGSARASGVLWTAEELTNIPRDS